jgi:hypothetical protein
MDLRGWTIVFVMALWMCLNAFDLLVTYDGLADGTAYEANRVFARIMATPLIAVSLKMLLAYIVLKLVERVETRTPYSGLAPLLAANLYLCWACLHNLHVIGGSEEGLQFLRYYPLAGLPR